MKKKKEVKTLTLEDHKAQAEKWHKYVQDKVYVVEMLRWNSRENHSYVIGCFHTEKEAIKQAVDHMEFRGGKYSAEITGYRNETEEFYWQALDIHEIRCEKRLEKENKEKEKIEKKVK
jgi:hypothetical protein